MNTPTFECEQNNTHIIVKIRVPYITLKDVDFVINREVLRFYAKPYFLRLTFPHPLDSSGSSDSTDYDIDTHIFTLKIGKIKPGLDYPNLNMISKLLQKPKGKTKTKPLIEVLESDFTSLKVSENETFDWEQVVEPKIKLLQDEVAKNGFNGEYTNVFENNSELHAMVEVSSPDSASPNEKYELMMSLLRKEFNSDHLLFDLINFQKEAQVRINFSPFYIRQVTDPEFNKKFKWLEEEQRFLTSLPKKEFLVGTIKRVWITLLDILVSFCYNERINYGEDNSESAWNITKLCSSFSWLVEHNSMEIFVNTFTYRVLTYPLIRNFELAIACLKDVSLILNRKEIILRCLIKANKIFKISDFSIHSRIFLRDYCVWIQSVSNQHVEKVKEMLISSIKELMQKKYQVASIFCLKEIEEYAKEEIQENLKNSGENEEIEGEEDLLL